MALQDLLGLHTQVEDRADSVALVDLLSYVSRRIMQR